MPRGRKPVPSDNPKEQRVITWRHNGRIHNALIDYCKHHGLSSNQVITKAITKLLYPDQPEPRAPYIPQDTDDELRL